MRRSGLIGLALQQSFMERKVVILQVFAKNEKEGYLYKAKGENLWNHLRSYIPFKGSIVSH